MFPHSLNLILGVYVIPLGSVLVLICFNLKGRPKMRQFFEFFYILNKKLIFLSMLVTIIIISYLIIIKVYCPKIGCFGSV